jgi:putative acetyltransferase
MPLSFTIGETVPEDEPQMSQLYASAFPEEELVPLVEALLPDPGVLSLSARIGAQLIGHVLFTRGALEGCPETVALLGPLAVHPDHQRRGIGKALIVEGLARLTTEAVTQVLVLGDPAYYSRSGFRPASRVTPPYPLPAKWAEAWQWQRLDGGDDDLCGRLILPEAWMRPELWG